MKNIKYILSLVLVLSILVSCEEEKYEFGDIITPTNIQVAANIIGQDATDPDLAYGDGSGFVDLIATAENAISYNFNFGDGVSEVSLTGEISHLYTKVGVNSYTVIITANGTGGVTSTSSLQIDVFSSFDDPVTKDFLSGGANSSKTWYWAADKAGNIGLGPNEVQVDGTHTYPAWFSSNAFHDDKLCMYDAEMVFTQDGDGNLTFQQTVGSAYLPGSQAGVLGVDGDTCYGTDLVPSLGNQYNVALISSSSPATEDAVEPTYLGTTIQFSDNGFMSWYVDNSNFEIITITDTTLSVRVEDGGNAWYCNFQTQNPNEIPASNFNTLVWSDEFDTNGTPDAANWTYDLGAGGWGNQEVQTYTSDAENVIVEDGVLKIIAKADGSGGYTSARLKSQGLQSFTYGKIEVRAKLPASQGTWPAIWMLGSNFETVGWPTCGEIDIMEQTGWDKTKTSSALHFEGNSGGDAPTSDIDNTTSTTAYNNYAVEWTEETITFSVDDQVVFSYLNTSSLPFNADFFFILNIAMGGTLGGDIDPAFSEDVMEIDYVRVYQ